MFDFIKTWLKKEKISRTVDTKNYIKRDIKGGNVAGGDIKIDKQEIHHHYPQPKSKTNLQTSPEWDSTSSRILNKISKLFFFCCLSIGAFLSKIFLLNVEHLKELVIYPHAYENMLLISIVIST